MNYEKVPSYIVLSSSVLSADWLLDEYLHGSADGRAGGSGEDRLYDHGDHSCAETHHGEHGYRDHLQQRSVFLSGLECRGCSVRREPFGT